MWHTGRCDPHEFYGQNKPMHSPWQRDTAKSVSETFHSPEIRIGMSDELHCHDMDGRRYYFCSIFIPSADCILCVQIA